MDASKTRKPIPEFDTLEEIANFWDTHSTADDDDLTQEVDFEVTLPDGRQPLQRSPKGAPTLTPNHQFPHNTNNTDDKTIRCYQGAL